MHPLVLVAAVAAGAALIVRGLLSESKPANNSDSNRNGDSGKPDSRASESGGVNLTVNIDGKNATVDAGDKPSDDLSSESDPAKRTGKGVTKSVESKSDAGGGSDDNRDGSVESNANTDDAAD